MKYYFQARSLLLIAAVAFNFSCTESASQKGNSKKPATNSPTPTGVPGATVTYATLSSTIFSPKCYTCHSQQFASYASLMAQTGWIVANNSSGSKLYTSVTAGAMVDGVNVVMPKDASIPLTEDEKNQIKAWIDAGAPENSSSSVPTTNANATYTYLNTNLFSTNCVSCHSSTNKSANYDLSTYDAISASGGIAAGSPDSSKILNVLTAANGAKQMPPSGSINNQALVDALRAWIQAGAQNN